MKLTAPRRHADPEIAARKLPEIAKADSVVHLPGVAKTECVRQRGVAGNQFCDEVAAIRTFAEKE
jgi:hypothetical protein